MPTYTIAITPKCSYVVRMTNGTQNTTTSGRLNGNQINFSNISYYDYSMRRKAETLQYNKIATTTNKTDFSKLVTRKGSYSQAALQKIISLRVNENCPIKITPPSNSGVIDKNSNGYYLDVSVPYSSNL
uniref:Uncharacterized protein n=1 Tax=viral metagenome TaxID=1070528 RepID=A0A6C0JML6_9ZZZZ